VQTSQTTAQLIIHYDTEGATKSFPTKRIESHSSTPINYLIAALLSKGGIAAAVVRCKDRGTEIEKDRDEVLVQQYYGTTTTTQRNRPSHYYNAAYIEISTSSTVRRLDGIVSHRLVYARTPRDSQSQGRYLNAPPARDAVVGRDA